MKSIIQEVKEIEKNYKTTTIDLADGLTFNMYETLRTIDFYSNSKYLKGNKDSKGRIKPFYNIVNALVDTSIVATDIDTKDITIVADDTNDFIRSFLLSKDVQNWMKETNFAKTLNEMGETRARYGGVLVKKTVSGKDLKIECVDWQNVVVNPSDIEGGIIIEKHYLLASELAEKKDVWNNVDEVIEHYSKQKKFSVVNDKICIYEVTGFFPETYDPELEDGDEYTFKKMEFFLAGLDKKDAILFSREIKGNKYKYLPWKRVPKRALGRGVVEEGFEAQVGTNDAIRKEAEAMEIGSKVVFKTTSKKIGNNVQGVDNGHIIELDAQEDFSQVNTMSNALPEFRSLQERWFSQVERATFSYDAQRGETPPSGQPYRLQALVQSQSGSMFDYRREELGIFLQEIFTEWIIPHLVKNFNKKHLLSFEFSADELTMIDKSFAQSRATKKAKEDILAGKLVTPEMYQGYFDSTLQEVQKTKNQRFIEIPDNYFDNIQGKVSIITTGEQKNKQATLESMSNILMTVAQNPAVLQNPALSEIFGRILELSGAGISPALLAQLSTSQPIQPETTPSPVPEQPQEQLA